MKTFLLFLGLVSLALAQPSTTPAVNATATVGQAVTFTVTTTGFPTPTVQWQKNGNPISGATAYNFVLPAAQLTDAAVYTVVATNSQGSVTSAPATLAVTPALSAPTVSSITILIPSGK